MKTGYKGFDKELKCQGFQYEVGKEYEYPENKVRCCPSVFDVQNGFGGFHFCTNPFDVLGYYDPATGRFAEVKSTGKEVPHDEDTKIATSKIKIQAEIGISDLISAGMKFILEKVDWTNNKESNTGIQSAATNTGYQSAATNTGYRSAATNTGELSAATNTGYRSAATVSGNQSIACGLGIENKAKGKLSCWLVLAEWHQVSNEWQIKDVKTAHVDGKKIKEDVWYKLIKGKFEEV